MNESLNPAAGLHTILTDALKQPENEPIQNVWQKVLGLPDGRTDLVIIALARLVELTFDIEREIRIVEGDGADVYLKSMQRVRDLLAYPQLGQHWKNLKNRLTPELTTRLEFCSHAIAKRQAWNEIPEDTLASLQQQVEELHESFMESDISADLKVVLLKLLDEIRNALIIHRIVGADGLRDTLAQSFGVLSFYWQPIKEEASETQVDKLGALIRNLNAAVSLALNVPKLTAEASKMLEILQN